MKRGTDHEWTIIKYATNMAIYARCKCGFEYICGRSKRSLDNSPSIKQFPTVIYRYCPNCGTKKKRYNKHPIKL